jgi:hypothetical protein
VIRFAIKIMLSKLSPLQDPAVKGRGLVPVFVESGSELMRHFELDAGRLAAILNEGVEESRRVDPEDIQLIAMSGVQRSYLKLRFAGLRRVQDSDGGKKLDGNGNNGHSNEQDAAEGDQLEQSLRQYLYEKYLFVRPADGLNQRAGGV